MVLVVNPHCHLQMGKPRLLWPQVSLWSAQSIFPLHLFCIPRAHKHHALSQMQRNYIHPMHPLKTSCVGIVVHFLGVGVVRTSPSCCSLRCCRLQRLKGSPRPQKSGPGSGVVGRGCMSAGLGGPPNHLNLNPGAHLSLPTSHIKTCSGSPAPRGAVPLVGGGGACGSDGQEDSRRGGPLC